MKKKETEYTQLGVLVTNLVEDRFKWERIAWLLAEQLHEATGEETTAAYVESAGKKASKKKK